MLVEVRNGQDALLREVLGRAFVKELANEGSQRSRQQDARAPESPQVSPEGLAQVVLEPGERKLPPPGCVGAESPPGVKFASRLQGALSPWPRVPLDVAGSKQEKANPASK